MAKILIVYHSQSGNTKAAAQVLAQGAKEIDGAEVVIKEALSADLNDLLSCDCLAVGTPDYFSYMAGGVKDFFDRTLYPSQGRAAGKPCAIFVSHGGGGRAVESVKDVCSKAFKLKLIAEPVLVKGKPDEQACQALAALGRSLAQAAG